MSSPRVRLRRSSSPTTYSRGLPSSALKSLRPGTACSRRATRRISSRWKRRTVNDRASRQLPALGLAVEAREETAKRVGASYRGCQSHGFATTASVSAMASWNPDSGAPRRGGPNPPPPGGQGEPAGEHVLIPLIHKHWMVLVRGMAIPVVVGIPLLVLSLAFTGGLLAPIVLAGVALAALWVWLAWAWATVTVTDERVIVKEGVLVRRTKVIPRDRCQD